MHLQNEKYDELRKKAKIRRSGKFLEVVLGGGNILLLNELNAKAEKDTEKVKHRAPV